MPYNKALTMMLLEFIQVLMKNMVLVQLTNFLDDEIILRKKKILVYKKYSCSYFNIQQAENELI